MSIKKTLMSILRYPSSIINKIVFYFHGVEFQGHSKLIGKISIINKGRILLGEKCILSGSKSRIGFSQSITLTTQRNAEIKIGNHVGMSNCTIYATKHIEIGDNTLIGGGVKIYDTDFHSTDWRIRNTAEDKQNAASAPVFIGNNCFIGAGSIVLKGVTIGKGAVIGAGSMITKDIPSFEVWAGNPAKRIRQLDSKE